MLRNLTLAAAVAAALTFPMGATAFAHPHGGPHGGPHFGGGGHPHFGGGGGHGFRGGGGGHGGRFWHGRYWGYGVGPCWRWNPFMGGWVWVCY